MLLTRKQHDILQFILEYRAKFGLSPTLEEIGDRFAVNRVTIHHHISELVKKGALRKSRRQSRSVEPLVSLEDEATSSKSIKILGRIAAGKPIEAIEDPEAFDFQDLIPPGGEVYMLRVAGNSMIDDGIHDGDLVLVEKKNSPMNGETVVAVLEGEEVTLKRFYRENGKIRLQPANESMDPIFIQEGQTIGIRGVVIGVIRQMRQAKHLKHL